MLFHRYHFFVGLVFCFCLQLGIELLYFAGAYQVGAGGGALLRTSIFWIA